MNTKDFFARLNKIAEPKKKDIIEKDFHLHRLLNKLSREPVRVLSKEIAF
ncbi:MAG: hypothetical protein ACLFVL_07960 [Candidatus Aenigmatarchaeota archaeon]